jgi:hypothetical protein
MPTNPLLTTTVRPDWEELTHQSASRQARYWTAFQLVLLFGTLLVLLPEIVNPSGMWASTLWAALFIPTAWSLPLVTIYRRSGLRPHVTQFMGLAVLGIVFAGLAITWLGASGALAAHGEAVGLNLSRSLGLLVPFLTWPLLAWTYWRFPPASRQMGLTPDGWLINTAIGAAAGAALGLSLVAAVGFRPDTWPSQSSGLLPMVWLLAYQAGLQAPAEELLFRGLIYGALLDDPSARRVPAITRVILLNMLVYVVPLVSAATIEGRLAILVYGAAMATTCTLLRFRQHSLLPGIAAKIVFSVFLAICVV